MNYLESLIWIVGPISSMAVFIMCIEVIYNLTHNQSFERVFRAIVFTISDMPYFLFLLFGFLSSFALLTNLTLGFHLKEFSNIFEVYVNLCDFMFRVPSLQYFEDDAFLCLLFLIPYMIAVRFLLLNMFFSNIYLGYMKSREESKEREK